MLLWSSMGFHLVVSTLKEKIGLDLRLGSGLGLTIGLGCGSLHQYSG